MNSVIYKAIISFGTLGCVLLDPQMALADLEIQLTPAGVVETHSGSSSADWTKEERENYCRNNSYIAEQAHCDLAATAIGPSETHNRENGGDVLYCFYHC